MWRVVNVLHGFVDVDDPLFKVDVLQLDAQHLAAALSRAKVRHRQQRIRVQVVILDDLHLLLGRRWTLAAGQAARHPGLHCRVAVTAPLGTIDPELVDVVDDGFLVADGRSGTALENRGAQELGDHVGLDLPHAVLTQSLPGAADIGHVAAPGTLFHLFHNCLVLV